MGQQSDYVKSVLKEIEICVNMNKIQDLDNFNSGKGLISNLLERPLLLSLPADVPGHKQLR